MAKHTRKNAAGTSFHGTKIRQSKIYFLYLLL
jgi:hypothetical protein